MAMTDAQLTKALHQAMLDTYTINYATSAAASDRAVARQERIIADVERRATPDQFNRFIGAASIYSPGEPTLVVNDNPSTNRPPRPTAAAAASLWGANRLTDPPRAARGASAPGAAGTGNS